MCLCSQQETFGQTHSRGQETGENKDALKRSTGDLWSNSSPGQETGEIKAEYVRVS